MYLPSSNGAPSLALLIRTPKERASDAYYQELLGTSVLMLLAQETPIDAFSNCSLAIKRTHQAQNTLGPAIGHLQHGTLLLGIRHIAKTAPRPLSLSWTASHPERTKSQWQWTDNDWGIHMADAIAGAEETTTAGGCHAVECDSEDIHAALAPQGMWHWREGDGVFNGSLRKRAQHYHFQQYLKNVT